MIAAVLSLVLTLTLFQSADRPLASGQDRCEIRGRVTDQVTGLPLGRLNVHIFRPDGQGQLIMTTDDEGRFRFSGLAPGRYSGMVEPGQFRGTHIFESMPTIVLAAAEVREINIALPRAFAINVRVVDPWGEPLSGLRVVAQSAETGRVVSESSWQQSTDDRGHVRLFGLPQGRYILCADAYGLGGPPLRTPERREGLLRTCYPSAAEDALAEQIRVDRAEAGELEIRMRRGRTFTIAGTVLGASGSPAAGANLSLAQHYANGSTSRSLIVDADGRFVAVGVHPGAYAIEAFIGGPERPEDKRPLEAGFVPVRVESADVDDIVVMMKKGVDVQGRATLEDPAAVLPSFLAPLVVSARLADDRTPGSGSSRSTTAQADRTFTLTGMFGSRVLNIQNVPRGWYVKSIRYGTREIIDEPVEFKDGTDSPSLEIVLGNRGAVVTGRVIDDRGNPIRATVLMLRTRGTGEPTTLAATATASPTGAFRLGPTRGGDYAIVAVAADTADLQPWEWERTARLAALGERITLGELDERTMELRLAARDRR